MKVAFLKGTGFYDRLIQIGTWGPYSHCEFVFSDGVWFGNDPGGDHKTKFHAPYKNLTNWDIVSLPDFYKPMESDVRKLAVELGGKEYDWKGIFLSQVLPLSIQDDDKYFCSEVVMRLIKKSGMFTAVKNTQSPNGVRRLLRKAGV